MVVVRLLQSLCDGVKLAFVASRVVSLRLGLSGNLVGISINLCKSIQKELFIYDTP